MVCLALVRYEKELAESMASDIRLAKFQPKCEEVLDGVYVSGKDRNITFAIDFDFADGNRKVMLSMYNGSEDIAVKSNEVCQAMFDLFGLEPNAEKEQTQYIWASRELFGSFVHHMYWQL
jgi:hypothetical protein